MLARDSSSLALLGMTGMAVSSIQSGARLARRRGTKGVLGMANAVVVLARRRSGLGSYSGPRSYLENRRARQRQDGDALHAEPFSSFEEPPWAWHLLRNRLQMSVEALAGEGDSSTPLR